MRYYANKQQVIEKKEKGRVNIEKEKTRDYLHDCSQSYPVQIYNLLGCLFAKIYFPRFYNEIDNINFLIWSFNIVNMMRLFIKCSHVLFWIVDFESIFLLQKGWGTHISSELLKMKSIPKSNRMKQIYFN